MSKLQKLHQATVLACTVPNLIVVATALECAVPNNVGGHDIGCIMPKWCFQLPQAKQTGCLPSLARHKCLFHKMLSLHHVTA